MTRVLDVLERDHDLVVIDTPPIPHVSDAISLLRNVDGALITVAVGSTRSQDAARLRDQLQGLDATVLGIVANGGALVTGSKLGEAMLALETHVLSRGAEPPSAGIEPQPGRPAPEADASGRIRPSFSAAGLTAAGGPVADPPASAEGGTTAGAAAAAQAAAPAAAAAPSAGPGARDAGARDVGARDRNRFAAAHGTAPAGWEALYAQGHHFQLQGNLVAAADAYRRAIRLNPHHPAMLYDLGYVLQMQGQSGAAMD